MKKISKIFIFSALILSGMWACKKEENRVIFKGGSAPVLAASIADSIPLSFVTKDNDAIQLAWTNPNYQFNTGISSLNVNYNIEIDTAGANFTNPNREVLSLGTDLSKDFTQSVFNDYLLNQLQLKPAISHNLELRVTAFLIGGAEPLASNVLKFTVIPFAIPPKVVPPTDGTLWLTGDATTSGYSNPLGNPYDVSQKFTKSSASDLVYELTVNMKGGGGYKLIQTQGNWDTQYHMITGGTWSGGDFKKENADPPFPGPPSSGSYKITVDFQRGKYVVTKL